MKEVLSSVQDRDRMTDGDMQPNFGGKMVKDKTRQAYEPRHDC